MKVTLYDFNNFSEAEKGEAVFKNGMFIDDRTETNVKGQLYRLDNFYVEVFYDAKANQIKEFRAFGGMSQLSHYINL